MAQMVENKGKVFGNEADSERTFVEVVTLRDLMLSNLVDWSQLGMIFRAIMGPECIPTDPNQVGAITDLALRAQHAYEAYGEVTSWKNYAGLPMPLWNQLPSKIQEAWLAATKHTLSSG